MLRAGASPALPSSICCASTTCILRRSAGSPWAPIRSCLPSPSPAHGSAQQQPGAALIHGFLVRKAEKAHGTGRRIEGFLDKDAPVLIVDDVCTTGASTITAIEATREAGMRVIAAVCLVEREEAGGRAALEAACQGAPFLRLYTANDVRAVARATTTSQSAGPGRVRCTHLAVGLRRLAPPRREVP